MAADLAAVYAQPLPHEPDAHGLLDMSEQVARGEINDESIRLLLQEGNLHESQGSNSVRSASHVGKYDGLAAESVLDSGQLVAASLTAAAASFVVPSLNSLAGAAASLYLDFDGHFEAQWGGYTNVSTPPLDRDGNSSELSPEELSFIEDVWRIVSEDYAPFNINVTTVEPAVLAAGVPADQANGVALRLAIGGTPDQINQPSGIAGFAYLNSFTNSTSNVAYVFPQSTPGNNRSASVIGTVASHEAGHSFGLHHHESGYDLDERRQSIMLGLSFGFDDAHWFSGTDQLGNYQDDIAELAGPINGFGFRSDDHADSIATATPLAFIGSNWTGEGVISTSDDADVWALQAEAGQSLKLSVNGSTVGQNLDVVIDLLDASGNVLLTSDPAESNDAEIVFETSGTQFIRVRSTGEYGRLGQYTISTLASTSGVSVGGPASLLTSETGASASFSVSLQYKPTSEVIIHLTPQNAGEGALSATTLQFTPANWYLPQTVTVAGVNDAVLDGPVAYAIDMTLESLDASYTALSIPSVQVVNADDELPGWAQQLSSLGPFSSLLTSDMRIDASGNLYVTGSFQGTVDFDLTPGINTRSSDKTLAGYVAKYTSTGQLAWVQVLVGDSSTYPTTLAIDSSSNVVVGGYTYANRLTLGSTTLSNKGSTDAFLTKLSGSGNFLWAQSWGSTDGDTIRELAIDGSGMIVVAGDFAGTVDFNPAKGTTTRTSAGGLDGYVARYTSAGAFSSVASFGGVNNDFLNNLVLDASSNAYVNGYFVSSTTIGGYALTSAGSNDDYLLKLNPTGAVQWVRQAIVPAAGGTAAKLSISNTGKLMWAFQLSGTVQFSAGGPVITGENTSNVLLTEWNTSGTLIQSGQLSSSSSLWLSDVAYDAAGRLIVFGCMAGTSDLDPTAGSLLQAPVGAASDFVLRLSGLEVIDAHLIPQTSPKLVRGEIALDARGNITLANALTEAAVSPSGQVLLNREGKADLYVARLNVVPEPVTLFYDSFETGERNGIWVEDAQNDWDRLTQRATQGNYSAEIDGAATNATLSLASSLNLTGYASPTLTFDWLIESEFDSGEFLSLDISTNGGATWILDVRRLSGNVSPENVWRSETVDLTPYATSNVKIRFRSTVSGSTEDANVDNVRIHVTPSSSASPATVAAAIATPSITSTTADKTTSSSTLTGPQPMLVSTATEPELLSSATADSAQWKPATKLAGPLSPAAVDEWYADLSRWSQVSSSKNQRRR